MCYIQNLSRGSVTYRLNLYVFHRQEGLAHEVLQWYICRMEAWFAADADMISLKSWDEASYTFYLICYSSQILVLIPLKRNI